MIHFKDVNLGKWFTPIDFERPVMPPQEVEETIIPGRAGSIMGEQRDGAYTLNVPFITVPFGRDEKDLRKHMRQLPPLLKGKGKLWFEEEPELYYYAMVKGELPLEEIIDAGKGEIPFYIYDPYAYAWDPEEIIIGSDEDPTLTIPTTFAQSFGEYIHRVGTAPTDLTLEIQMKEDADQIRITHEESGKYLELNGAFQSGDTVMIDMATHYVEHNGENAMTKLSLRSRFFRLEDTNKLTFTPMRGAEIIATYTPRYY